MKTISKLGKRVINSVGNFWFWFLATWGLSSVTLICFFCRLLRSDKPTPELAQTEAAIPATDEGADVTPSPSIVVQILDAPPEEMTASSTRVSWQDNPVYIELYELIMDECSQRGIVMPKEEHSSNDWFLGSTRDEESGK